MSTEVVRWKRRFAQYEKAFLLLETAIAIPRPSIIERAGLIKFFDLSLQLACTLLKEFEEARGCQVKSPRDAIELAVQFDVIREGHLWIEALDDQKLMAETYEEEIAVAVVEKIGRYLGLLRQLHLFFGGKVTQEASA